MGTQDWLLDSDPAIRWQAMRDLTAAHAEAISLERARVPHEGLGAEILVRQQPDGSWRRDDAPVWKTTLFTMQLLRATGIDPANPAVKSAAARLEAGLRWNNQGGRWELRGLETGGNTFFQGEVEPCINGGALALAAYFGRPTESLARAAAIGAKTPWRMPAFIGRLLIGEHGLVLMNEIRGASNEKAKRELEWKLTWPSWREGFKRGLSDTYVSRRITLNSVPTLRSRVEYVCRNVCHPNRF